MSSKWFKKSDNHILTSTITASNSDSNFPVSNLKLDPTVKEWKYTIAQPSVETIVFDLGSAKAVDYLLLASNVLESAGFDRIVLEANTSDSWGSPAFTSGNVDTTVDGKLYYALSSTQTYRYWRLSVSKQAGGTYVGFSNIFLGQSTELTNHGLDVNFSVREDTNTKEYKGLYGQRWFDIRNTVQSFSGRYTNLTVPERDTLKALFDESDIYNPVWLVVDPVQRNVTEVEELMFYGYFSDKPSFTHPAFGRWAVRVSVRDIV